MRKFASTLLSLALLSGVAHTAPAEMKAKVVTTCGASSLIAGTSGDAQIELSGVLCAVDRILATLTGSVTETIPATDTASSGLNGRLQRIAARLSTLILAVGSPLQAGGTVSIGTMALPTGAATAAKQPALGTAGTPASDVLTIQGNAAGTPVPVTFSPAGSQTVTNAGTFAVQNTAALPAGSAIIGNVGIDQTTPGTTNKVDIGTNGQVAATQSGTWTVQPGNTANTTAWKVDGSSVTQPVSGTFWQGTQPVSAASLPLPSGAAADATIATMSGKLPATLGQKPMASSLAVAVASDQSALPVTGTFWQATQPVSAASLPIPTGASTETTLASVLAKLSSDPATQTTLTNMSQKLPVTLGQKLLTTSLAVAIASDQTVPINQTQVNGVALLAGNGVTGTGSPRVTIASDTTVLPAVGADATGTTVPANAVYVANNVGGNTTGQIGCGSSAVYDAATTGSTQLVALSGATTIYVCGYTIVAGGTVSVKLITGTGSACATGSANITPAYSLVAQTEITDSSPVFRGLKGAASSALCINASGAIAVQAIVYYTQF